jgi:hypothetical protein
MAYANDRPRPLDLSGGQSFPSDPAISEHRGLLLSKQKTISASAD